MGSVLAPAADSGDTSATRRSASVGAAAGDRSQRLALVLLGVALLCACVVVLLGGRGRPLDAAAGRPRADPPYRVNVNEAHWAVLCLVPGLGETLSNRIVAYRETHGPFRSLDELTAVNGIGRARLRDMRPYLALGDTAGDGAAE